MLVPQLSPYKIVKRWLGNVAKGRWDRYFHCLYFSCFQVVAASSKQVVAAEPLPDGCANPAPCPLPAQTRVLSVSCLRWASAVDASTGREYYYHETTQESRWERPPSRTTTSAEVTAQLFRVGPGSRI